MNEPMTSKEIQHANEKWLGKELTIPAGHQFEGCRAHVVGVDDQGASTLTLYVDESKETTISIATVEKMAAQGLIE